MNRDRWRRLRRWLVLVWVFQAGVTWSHGLRPGDVLISPYGGFIETDSYMIRADLIPNWQVAGDLGHFRPELWAVIDYVGFSVREKATGHERTTLIPPKVGIEPHFTAFEERNYSDKRVLFVTVRRATPRDGGMPGLWVTTYIFAADTLAVLAEVDGAATDVTREAAA